MADVISANKCDSPEINATKLLVINATSLGRAIQCYALEDGNRTLNGRGMQEAVGFGQSHGSHLREFFEQRDIKPHINNSLAMVVARQCGLRTIFLSWDLDVHTLQIQPQAN